MLYVLIATMTDGVKVVAQYRDVAIVLFDGAERPTNLALAQEIRSARSKMEYEMNVTINDVKICELTSLEWLSKQ